MAGPALPIVERTQGCWNCTGFSTDEAVKFWSERRQVDLKIALDHALASPLGEKDPKVAGIKRAVDLTDQAVAAGRLGRCSRKGSEADLIALEYLCTKWQGRQGASVARDGAKADKLPSELMEDVAAGKLTKRKIT